MELIHNENKLFDRKGKGYFEKDVRLITVEGRAGQPVAQGQCVFAACPIDDPSAERTFFQGRQKIIMEEGYGRAERV